MSLNISRHVYVVVKNMNLVRSGVWLCKTGNLTWPMQISLVTGIKIEPHGRRLVFLSKNFLAPQSTGKNTGSIGSIQT